MTIVGTLRFGEESERRIFNGQYQKRRSYKIVSDALPFEDGGFRPGAVISSTEITYMLAAKTITLGTIVQWSNRKYTVSLTQRGAYCLIRIQQ